MGKLWEEVIGLRPTPAAKAVADKTGHDLADKNIEVFLSRIESFLQLREDVEAQAFLTSAKEKVLENCSKFLAGQALETHQMFLHRLSRRRVRDPRLKLFTTNYDLCFEVAAGRIGGVVLDGFSFGSPRSYDPRYFSYDIVRRPKIGSDQGSYLEGVFLLYKLHGSVNWARGNDGVITETEDPDPEEACLIYPARGKYQQSFTQPYLESMAQYLSAIREPNTCVLVAGFGFNDDHLSEPLLAAIKTNPHLRVVIVDRSLEDKLKTPGYSHYWNDFAHLGDDGDDVWLIQSDFDAFTRMIPDLKGLTPAESLMKAVKGAVEGT